MPLITKITAREILDSRDDPTVEVDLTLRSGAVSRAAAPAGASTGRHEAKELRDENQPRYGGRGVTKAVQNIEKELAPAVIGKDLDQKTLDEIMIALDGTKDKSRLGANAILAISLAFARAAAEEKRQPLYQYFQTLGDFHPTKHWPWPYFNMINGGRHAVHSTDIQEFLVIPGGAPNPREALRWGVEIFDALKKIIADRGETAAVGDEGGFVPSLPGNEAAFELLTKAAETAGFKPGKEIFLGIDAAASEFYRDGRYHLTRDRQILTAEELIKKYVHWQKNYSLVSIEDGLAEDDWENHIQLTATLGDKLQLVGDDLFATNQELLQKGIDLKAATAILIKPNQVGTISETLSVMKIAEQAGFKIIVSHRSGETEDTSIVHLAVGAGADGLKAGAPNRGERIAKYNELLRIAEIV